MLSATFSASASLCVHGYSNTPRDAFVPCTDRGNLPGDDRWQFVTSSRDLQPSQVASRQSIPLCTAERESHTGKGWGDLTHHCRLVVADFAVTPWPFALATKLMGYLALCLFIYHAFQCLFPVFAFLTCKPGLLLCPGAWSYSWLFWNVTCPLPTPHSPLLCIISLDLFCFLVITSIANSVCSAIMFFFKPLDQIIKGHRLQWK